MKILQLANRGKIIDSKGNKQISYIVLSSDDTLDYIIDQRLSQLDPSGSCGVHSIAMLVALYYNVSSYELNDLRDYALAFSNGRSFEKITEPFINADLITTYSTDHFFDIFLILWKQGYQHYIASIPIEFIIGSKFISSLNKLLPSPLLGEYWIFVDSYGRIVNNGFNYTSDGASICILDDEYNKLFNKRSQTDKLIKTYPKVVESRRYYLKGAHHD